MSHLIKCDSFTLKGIKCCKKAQRKRDGKSYCSLHYDSPITEIKVKQPRERCNSVTVQGKKCIKYTMLGKKYCNTHKNKEPPDLEESKTEESKTEESKTEESKTEESKTEESKDSSSVPKKKVEIIFEEDGKDTSDEYENTEKYERTEEPPKKRTTKKEKPPKKEKPIRIRCKGITQKGTNCSRYPWIDSEYCGLHQSQQDESDCGDKSEDSEPEAEYIPKSKRRSTPRKKCGGKTKTGRSCMKYAINGSEYCSAHKYNGSTNGKYNYYSSSSSYNNSSSIYRCCYTYGWGIGQCVVEVSGPGKYCVMHKPYVPPPSYKCCYKYNNGVQCTIYVLGPNQYCQSHKPYVPPVHKCCYRYNNGVQCIWTVPGPNQYCSMHKSSIPCVCFKNNILDKKLVWMTEDKKRSLINAMKNYGIDPPNITVISIKKIYRERALKHHPDKGGNAEIFKQNLHDKDVMLEFLS